MATGATKTLPQASATRRPVLALLSANAISLVGNQLTLVAIPWFVLQTTGDAAKVGLVAFFTVLPTVLAALFGGAIVDRLGFKRTSVLADLASGLTVAMVPLLHATVGLAFWQLLVLVFLGALLDAPGGTARTALFPDVVGLAGMPLERANAAYQAIQRLAGLLGPLLAGLLVALLGASNVLWVDAATFAVSAALVVFAVPGVGARAAPAERYVNQMLAGLRFVRRDRLILALTATIAITNFLDAPLFAVVLPVYAERTFGSAADLGLLLAGFGGGAFAGSVLFGAVGHRLPRRGVFIGAFIGAGMPMWVLATMPPLAVAVAALVVAGLAAGPLNPVLMTVAQERVPADMRGRVFGAFTAMAFIAMPAGMLLAGFLIEAVGLRTLLLAIAGCYLAVTVSMLFNPALHEMGAPTATMRANG